MPWMSDRITAMKRNLPFLFLFLISLASLRAQDALNFGRERIYDPFYDAVVELADGTQIDLTASSFHNMEDEQKYFFWIRRGTETGVVTYALELNRIREVEFTDVFGTPDNDFTPARITLTNGNTYDIFMDTLGYMGGFDPDFGSYARLFLHYNLVKSIRFKQDGTYRLCPHCGTVFYSAEAEVCPFDKTPLVGRDGVLAENPLGE